MKPRVFIGSSVEGLEIAYAIQQNLTYDADVTVWDQGVFELSKTTIESLIDIINKTDFGVFVFNKDDITKMRNKSENVVRDNVLFEFGLFIGKLGRERVYFVIPNRTNLHLPSDLLGITPGKFDPNREDKSLQAATGPVCHQIRLRIKDLGCLNPLDQTSKEPDQKNSSMSEDDWVEYFLKKEYLKSIEILEKQLSKTRDKNEKLETRKWIAYCKFKIDENEGIRLLDDLLKENAKNVKIHEGIARIYLWLDYFDRSIEILTNALKKFNDNQDLKIILSECYKKTEGEDKALEYLIGNSPETNMDIALEIVSIYMERKQFDKAREVIHPVYLKWPNNERIRYQYSRTALELKQNEIALYFLYSLTIDFPDNSTYWGYLGNCYLELNLYDLALASYRKANELTKEKEEWINSNIGNILKNKGFYSESIKYFEKGIEINKGSNYAHDRLSMTLKLKDEEAQKAISIARDGRIKLREYNTKN